MSEDKRCRWCGADDTAESITEDILAHESNCPKTLGRMASKLAEERAEDVRAVDALTERVEQVESDLRAAGIAGAGVWQQEEEDRQECPSSDARERARKVLEEMLDPATDGKKFVNPADAILDALEGEGVFEAPLIPCPNNKAHECLDSPDGINCACCGCVETRDEIIRLRAALKDAPAPSEDNGIPETAPDGTYIYRCDCVDVECQGCGEDVCCVLTRRDRRLVVQTAPCDKCCPPPADVLAVARERLWTEFPSSRDGSGLHHDSVERIVRVLSDLLGRGREWPSGADTMTESHDKWPSAELFDYQVEEATKTECLPGTSPIGWSQGAVWAYRHLTAHAAPLPPFPEYEDIIKEAFHSLEGISPEVQRGWKWMYGLLRTRHEQERGE